MYRVAKRSPVATLIGTLYNIGCGGGKQAYMSSHDDQEPRYTFQHRATDSFELSGVYSRCPRYCCWSVLYLYGLRMGVRISSVCVCVV